MSKEKHLTRPIENLRPELQKVVEMGCLVQRFAGADLPTGVIKDDVGKHIHRLNRLSKRFHLPEITRQTLLIHDLPEIISVLSLGRNSDITAPEKAVNPELKKQVAELELATAHQILTPNELYLYTKFEEATEDFAIYAQILDKMDASLTLHRFLSVWSYSPSYDVNKIQSSPSTSYSLNQIHHLIWLINKSMNQQNAFQALKIIEECTSTIHNWWKSTKRRGVVLPVQIEEFLSTPNLLNRSRNT